MEIASPLRMLAASFVGLIGLSSGCSHRAAPTEVDAGQAADARVPDTLFVVQAVPVSEILFDDVHLTTGNPRKINPNTPGATEPDNLVRLRIKPVVTSPPPLGYTWSVDLGQIVSDSGSEIRFKSSSEGTARVRCRVANLATGESLLRELVITVKKASQAFPLINGDHAVWTLSPGEIQAVHLPTRKLRVLGPGSAESFDGKRVFGKPPQFAQYKFLLYDVVTGKQTTVATQGMKSAWDHRFLRVAGDRLYWANVSTTYAQYTLYTMDLDTKLEELVFGPKLVLHATLSGKRLVFASKPLDVYSIANHVYDPAAKTTTALIDLDPLGMVVSQHDPWVVLRDLSKYTLLNLATKETRKVETTLPDIVSALVSGGYYGGNAREAFGDKGEIFVVALDGSHERRVLFNHNDFMHPDMDGGRIVYMHDGDIYLLEAK